MPMRSSHPNPVAASSTAEAKAPRLLDELRARMRRLGLSLRTEEAYVGWARRFILANGKRHPREMGAREVEAFLTGLATRGRVAASTQNQALAALLFLYREVLALELPWMDDIRRAKKPERLPTVLTREEVAALLAQMSGATWLMAGLLYGAGLRLMECLRLRVQDADFVRREIRCARARAARTGARCCRRWWSMRCRGSWPRRGGCTSATWPQVLARCGCRMRWIAST